MKFLKMWFSGCTTKTSIFFEGILLASVLFVVIYGSYVVIQVLFIR